MLEIIIYKIHGGFKTIWNYQVQNANNNEYSTIISKTFNEGTGTKRVTFTEAEQKNFYKFLNTRNSASYRISVDTYNGNNYMETKSQYGTIYVGTANPIFSDFTYKDINSKTIQLTGNPNKFIKKYSNAQITISEANKATPVKEATMTKYRTIIGTKQVEAPYKSTGNVLMTINNVDSKDINVYAIDSRNNSKLVKKTLSADNFIDYKEINIKSATLQRENGGIGTGVILNFNGQIFNGNFGTKENSITSCKYKFREVNTSSEYIEGLTDITPNSIENGTFSNSLSIKGDLEALGFDNSKSFEVIITIKDELSEYSYNILLGAGIPLVAYHKNGVSFGALYDEELGGRVQMEGSKVMYNDIITGRIPRHSHTFSESWKPQKIGNIQESSRTGNKLSISDGSIIIGKNIKKILASINFKAFNSNQLKGDFVLSVLNNDEEYGTIYFQGINTLGWRPGSVPPTLIDVQEGDKIDVGGACGGVSTIEFLDIDIMVQVIE